MRYLPIFNLLTLAASFAPSAPSVPTQNHGADYDLSNLSTKTAVTVEVADLSCPEERMSRITLWTGPSEYILLVPANGTKVNVVGPDSYIGCVGPVGHKYAMCQACNFPIQRLDIDAEAGTCAFNFSGYQYIVYHTPMSGPFTLPIPAQLLDVTCGLSPSILMRRDASQSSTEPVACPAWGDKTTIEIWEGSFQRFRSTDVKFDLEIRPDGSLFQLGQPPFSVGCLRRDKLYRDQCFPCTMPIHTLEVARGIDCTFEVWDFRANLSSPMFMPGPQQLEFGGLSIRLLTVACHRKPTLEDGSRPTCFEDGLPVTLWNGHEIVFYLVARPDMQYYSLSGENPQAGCFTKRFPLVECYSCQAFKIDALQPDRALEECRFHLEGYDEFYVIPVGQKTKSVLKKPTRLLGVQCGFGVRNNPPRPRARSTQTPVLRSIGSLTLPSVSSAKCRKRKFSEAQMVWVWGTTTTERALYELRADSDGKWYKLYEDNPNFGCAEVVSKHKILQQGSAGCYQCEMVVDQILFQGPSSGVCSFRMDGCDETIRVGNSDNRTLIHRLEVPKRILEVKCEASNIHTRPQMALETSQSQGSADTVANDPVDDLGASSHIAKGMTRMTRNIGPTPVDVRCKGHKYKTAINTSDGNPYFAPVPLDNKFHPMAEMFCIRSADSMCIPCGQIGSAISVKTEIRWGPCLFFTEDHRSFFTQYWNSAPDGSGMTPVSPIDPGNAISGIECGSGAREW